MINLASSVFASFGCFLPSEISCRSVSIFETGQSVQSSIVAVHHESGIDITFPNISLATSLMPI